MQSMFIRRLISLVTIPTLFLAAQVALACTPSTENCKSANGALQVFGLGANVGGSLNQFYFGTSFDLNGNRTDCVASKGASETGDYTIMSVSGNATTEGTFQGKLKGIIYKNVGGTITTCAQYTSSILTFDALGTPQSRTWTPSTNDPGFSCSVVSPQGQSNTLIFRARIEKSSDASKTCYRDSASLIIPSLCL